jgi:hypothetical protein
MLFDKKKKKGKKENMVSDEEKIGLIVFVFFTFSDDGNTGYSHPETLQFFALGGALKVLSNIF